MPCWQPDTLNMTQGQFNICVLQHTIKTYRFISILTELRVQKSTFYRGEKFWLISERKPKMLSLHSGASMSNIYENGLRKLENSHVTLYRKHPLKGLHLTFYAIITSQWRITYRNRISFTFPSFKMHRHCSSKKNESIHEWTLNDESASSYHERLSLLQNEIAWKWEM